MIDTHGSELGVLCLVGVVIQSNEVEARLHLVAASSKHVQPAHTLSRVRVTAAETDVYQTFSHCFIMHIEPHKYVYCLVYVN